MRPLLRPEEMAAADAAAIEAGTSGAVLMERAGRAVARAVIDLAGARYGSRVLIVCGSGNNGGDGFVVARRLAREGLGVRCLTTFDVSESGGDAAAQLAQMRAAGVEPEPFTEAIDPAGFDVVVDAIFGTGFRGPAEGMAAEAIRHIDGHPRVVSIDIPSGVDGLSGRIEGPAVHAVVTVALGAQKTGTALPPGAVNAGHVVVADIGIPVNIRKFEDAPAPDGTPSPGIVVSSYVEMAEGADVAASLPPRSLMEHKRSVGSVAVFAGSDEMRGAALLTARGAMRVGAGYVTLVSSAGVLECASARIPELLCTRGTTEPILGSDAVDRAGTVIERADAIAVGPGLGVGNDQRALVHRLLAEARRPIVLDADGLNVLEGDPSPLMGAAGPVIITPHPAELARLLGSSTKEVIADRMGAALQMAAELPSVVVVAKGYRTVVAYAGGKAAVVIPVGGPELATAGTGDVLTGILAGLLAAGHPSAGGAIAGAYLHGIAGSVAGQRMGSQGVVAWDVAEAVPEAYGHWPQR